MVAEVVEVVMGRPSVGTGENQAARHKVGGQADEKGQSKGKGR